MRLLEIKSHGELSFIESVGDKIPPYAILSHKWGEDYAEVTFKDLMKDTGKTNVGYDKIRSCGVRVSLDGLQYFWVDTCCTIQSHHR